MKKLLTKLKMQKIHFFLKVIIAFFVLAHVFLESTVIAQQISNNDWLRLGKEAFLKNNGIKAEEYLTKAIPDPIAYRLLGFLEAGVDQKTDTLSQKSLNFFNKAIEQGDPVSKLYMAIFDGADEQQNINQQKMEQAIRTLEQFYHQGYFELIPLICVKQIMYFFELLEEVKISHTIKIQYTEEILHWRTRLEGHLMLCEAALEGLQKTNHPDQREMLHFFNNFIIPYLTLGKSIVDGLIDNVIFPLLETGKSPAEANYFEKYWNNETTKNRFREKIASEFKSQAFIEKIEKRNKRMGLLILGFGSEFLLSTYSAFEQNKNFEFPGAAKIDFSKIRNIVSSINLDNLVTSLPLY